MPGQIINLNGTSPAAPSGAINVAWQKGAESGTDPVTGAPIYPASANVPAATDSALGVVRPDGTSLLITAGVLSVAAGGVNHYPFSLNVGVPSLASLTQVNVSGTGSAVENAGVALTLVDTAPPPDASVVLRALAQAAPGTAPWRVAFYVLADIGQYQYPGFGVGFMDSGTGKLEVLIVNDQSNTDSAGNYFEHQSWNSATSRDSLVNITNIGVRYTTPGIWLGLRDDGAGNVIWEISQTGAFWTPVLTVGKSSGWLASYSDIVFCLFCDDNTFSPALQIAASVLCWDTTAISGRAVGYVG